VGSSYRASALVVRTVRLRRRSAVCLPIAGRALKLTGRVFGTVSDLWIGEEFLCAWARST
jgi:hypothetical protein